MKRQVKKFNTPQKFFRSVVLPKKKKSRLESLRLCTPFLYLLFKRKRVELFLTNDELKICAKRRSKRMLLYFVVRNLKITEIRTDIWDKKCNSDENGRQLSTDKVIWSTPKKKKKLEDHCQRSKYLYWILTMRF